MPEIRPASLDDTEMINALHARCFGPGRFARTAYRIRENCQQPAAPTYSHVMLEDGQLVASVQLCEISIGGKDGALLLGPMAVDPDKMRNGLGTKLIEAANEAARSAGYALIILVGDMPFYGRLGFKPVPTGQVLLPGPVDYQRLLALELKPDALQTYNGLVSGI